MELELRLQREIEVHLERIERILGPNYKLTLIAKYNGSLPLLNDVDILLTRDTRLNMLSVIDRFKPL